MPTPGRTDDETLPDAHDREVGLPCLRPIRLVDDPRPELADRTQPESLQVSERGRDIGDGPGGRRPVACWHVGTDRRRPGRIDTRAESFLDELERRLDRRPPRCRPTEDL